MELAAGQVYGEKYRIVRLLGQGSMGAVYEGENIRIHRKVAIKTLHAGMAEKGDTLQRFEREAQAAGRIGSMHICEVLDMGDLPDGSRYMVMEHLDGVTLQQHIRANGRLKPAEAAPVVEQLLEGLGAAHRAGIIHRDLKPANVFLVRQPGRPDFVKILDFGVSKFSVLSEEMSMTRTGAVLGTPYYMSPEQAKGARGTDARSDLYAVGVILYECITGQVPFSAETFNELLFRIVLETPPPPESYAPDLPPEFAALIRKAMAREPNDRFQTADEFKKAIVDWEASAHEVFDGNATLDQQTVMRVSPLAALGPRPAPPSTTASGMMIVEPRAPAAAAPALGALGTVIIDPAAQGVPLPPPNAPPQRAGNLPTQPLPQWIEAPPPAVSAAPGGPPAAAYALSPFVPVEQPTGSQRAPRRASPMRAVAFLGVAVGLLLGLSAWAMFWRTPDDAPGSARPAPSARPAASIPVAVATATDPGATAAPFSSGSASGSASASAEPSIPAPPETSSAAASDPALSAQGSPAGARSAKAAGSSSSKASATPSASASASGKAGATNPSGKRTVSTDL